LQGPHLCMNEDMPLRQVILGFIFNDYLLVKALHTLVFALVHICLGIKSCLTHKGFLCIKRLGFKNLCSISFHASLVACLQVGKWGFCFVCVSTSFSIWFRCFPISQECTTHFGNQHCAFHIPIML